MTVEPARPADATARTSARLIGSVLRLDRWRLLAATLLASGHQIGEALVPVVVGVVIDDAIDGGSSSDLARGIGLLAVVFVGLSFSYRFFARIVVRLEELAAHDLRLRVVDRVLDGRGGTDSHTTGALQRLANTDTTAVAGVVEVVPTTMAALAALVVTVIALFNVSVVLGVAVTAAALVTLVVMHLLGRPFEARIHTDQERSAEVAGVAADLMTGVRVIKGMSAENAATDRYRTVSRSSLDASLRAARFESGFTGLASLVTGTFLAFVAFVAGREAIQGDIGVGALIAVVGLAQFLIGPLERLISASAALARCRASSRRVAALLATPARHTGSGRLSDRSDPLVDLAFEQLEAPGLARISFEIPSGSIVGIAAADPTASASLVDVLAAEAVPDGGEVRVRNTPLSALDPDSLRRVVLAPPHDPDLFDTSLLDNLVMHEARTDVADAITAAAADELVESLPEGLAANLGERGVSLSGGQRQRVALARALVADPPVLVLHEPTTAVDTATEAEIAAGLRRVRGRRTTVIVTTSPTLLAACDEVVHIVEGQVAARGGHAELLDVESYRAAVLA